ncbi:hypothetical protein [Deinococcus rubellus]|uniref:hypothetical protein n=1 Tax=Deinococcus rubellus TaxID=1889240 RepID=UPI0031ED2CD1
MSKVAAQVDEARRSIQHVPTLSAGCLYFAEVIREWLQDDAQARTDALFQALRRHLQVVTVDLEEEDDPQVVFESLNLKVNRCNRLTWCVTSSSTRQLRPGHALPLSGSAHWIACNGLM